MKAKLHFKNGEVYVVNETSIINDSCYKDYQKDNDTFYSFVSQVLMNNLLVTISDTKSNVLDNTKTTMCIFNSNEISHITFND